jgi:hypothetical protein
LNGFGYFPFPFCDGNLEIAGTLGHVVVIALPPAICSERIRGAFKQLPGTFT